MLFLSPRKYFWSRKYIPANIIDIICIIIYKQKYITIYITIYIYNSPKMAPRNKIAGNLPYGIPRRTESI